MKFNMVDGMLTAISARVVGLGIRRMIVGRKSIGRQEPEGLRGERLLSGIEVAETVHRLPTDVEATR